MSLNTAAKVIDEIDDAEFFEIVIENFGKMMGHIALVNLNIRIHWGIAGEWKDGGLG